MLFLVSALDTAPVLEGMDDNVSVSLSPVLAEEEESEEESVPRPQPRRQVCQKRDSFLDQFYCVVSDVVVLQGNKRRAVDQSSALASSEGSSARRSLPLKARYGIQAWKRWALSSSEQPEEPKVKEASKPSN